MSSSAPREECREQITVAQLKQGWCRGSLAALTVDSTAQLTSGLESARVLLGLGLGP